MREGAMERIVRPLFFPNQSSTSACSPSIPPPRLSHLRCTAVPSTNSPNFYTSCTPCFRGCQVDNHLPGAIFPVLVSKRREEKPPHGDDKRLDDGGNSESSGRSQRQETPFLQLSIIKEVNQSTNTAHYDYVACRWVSCGSSERVREARLLSRRFCSVAAFLAAPGARCCTCSDDAQGENLRSLS